MQVSSYLKNARRSMRHKLIGYMIVLAVLLVAALYAGLTLFGRLSSPKAEIKEALDLQMEIFQNDMESLWHNVSVMSILLSEDMTALLEDTLVQQGISFDDLDGNAEATKAVEDAMLEPLSQYVRQADCSGAFVVMESSMSDGDTADARSGLYVQRANAGRVTNSLLLFCAIVCCLYLARRYLAPVHRDLDRLRDEDRGGEQMAFADFEPISATLQAQDRENEKIITTLEQEKQTVQEQAVQLLDRNEELQGQFEAAQADAQRLAYFRKSEIDPATYEMFLVGYDMLTPTEREILEALADGSSPRELSEQRNCSESTIATHRKNIYRKLGIHKAYQLKICIALLRQEREAQN